MSFESYTDCLLRAFQSHPKSSDVVKRKQEILKGVAEFHNFVPDSVLYVGFNPAILAETANTISVTYISKEARDFLNEHGIQFTYIPPENLHKFQKYFESVVALDEYFTFANTDQDQRTRVEEICNLATEYMITTCKDYKNQEFKDREFSVPALIRTEESNDIYLEFHDHDIHDRNSWSTNVYEISDKNMNAVGPFDRRALFFKQLAKFTSDAGAVGFSVHKNLMYKSLIKKNYEHVISIRFDNNGH
ncbi:hypothetical protein UFOVP257_192 [uncultured Caudovirales phage]|uniref:Uncharacterized protein n=1 Tax=uncultured Caudovirales phage TaxID=2100421 RepID=A0A6J5LK37_9CAUD|nr:hypothetical protein UFOVP257_192 [uncultured Caudovirales phage]